MDKLRILLVDDEDDFRHLIAAKIKDWGHICMEASRGKEALKVLKNNDADVVVLDYIMPEMDGLTVLRNIKKIGKDIEVIMFTAYPDKRSISGTDRMGVCAYVPKFSVYSDTAGALRAAIEIARKRIKKAKGGPV